MIIVNLFTSHNINLGVPFAYGSLHPNFCFAETILNNNIMRNFSKRKNLKSPETMEVKR